MTTPIIHAYELDNKGGGKPIEINHLHHRIDSNLLWVHLNADHEHIEKWLENEIDSIDPLIIDALLSEEPRPRVMPYDGGVLIILRGVNLNKNADPEDMVSIRLLITQHQIISVQGRHLKAITEIEHHIKNNKGPKNVGEFLCMLVDLLFSGIEDFLSILSDSTDSLEEEIMDTTDSSLRESITQIRKQAIIFRRYMAPQRDAIDQLRISKLSWLKEIHRRNLHESYNHVTRYIEDLDAIRERAQIVKDELSNLLSSKINQNMYILSLIAAIFLPLGFITSLLGINVGGIPGATAPSAFYIVCAILTVIVILQVTVFNKFKWF